MIFSQRFFAFLLFIIPGTLIGRQLPVISNDSALHFTEVLPGVWKCIVGQPEAYDLLKASGAMPDKAALKKLGGTVFPFGSADIAGVIQDGNTSLRFPLDRGEQL
ncbi:MAG TPA: hypothetical protein VK625_17160, partial [Flavitalea sp.]|nr:hypothetical protein [Flavitalea sp.]